MEKVKVCCALPLITSELLGIGVGQGRLPPQMRHETIPESEWEQYQWLAASLGVPRFISILSG